MKTPRITIKLFVCALAFCLIGLSALPASAARVDQVTKGSTYANHFKVEAKKTSHGVRVSVTAPTDMQAYQLSSMTFYTESHTLISTNGSSIEFLIDTETFEKGYVTAGFTDPNHDPVETGGYWAFQLDISSLAGELK